jgi:hypothetical protein
MGVQSQSREFERVVNAVSVVLEEEALASTMLRGLTASPWRGVGLAVASARAMERAERIP